MKNFAFTIVIGNIKNPNLIVSGGVQNKYKGAYKKILHILNEDFMFVEYKSEDEELIGNDFYLYFNLTPDIEKLERILKIPNVEIISQRYPQGILVAPNGKPSNLTPEQYELVRTSAFKKWFGDWEKDPANSSKVVDDNGEPLVVYHGTYVENPFYIFDFDKADLGFHFGTYEQAKNRSETKLFFRGRKSIVNSFFLNIKTVFESTDIGEWEYPQRYIDMFVSDGLISESDAKKNGFYRLVQREENKQIREYLLNKYGQFGGFVYNNKYEGKGKSFIVLNPNQIKLADGTNSTFDSSNDDIRFKQGGAVFGKPTEFYQRTYADGTTQKFSVDDYENNIYPNLEKGGRTIAQTPAPKKDQVYGSSVNKTKSSTSVASGKLIKFDEKTLEAIKSKVSEHNKSYPNKKISLASAKAVVRRGFGAYSSSHRPTISGGKPNSRVAWGLARLNAFIYKIVNGKSKSGKYKQDDDLIEELGYEVENYKNGGKMKKDIRCINCGWEWDKKDSEAFDMYVCHKCGFDNTTFYTSDIINKMVNGGKVEGDSSSSPDYLKMFLGK